MQSMHLQHVPNDRNLAVVQYNQSVFRLNHPNVGRRLSTAVAHGRWLQPFPRPHRGSEIVIWCRDLRHACMTQYIYV